MSRDADEEGGMHREVNRVIQFKVLLMWGKPLVIKKFLKNRAPTVFGKNYDVQLD